VTIALSIMGLTQLRTPVAQAAGAPAFAHIFTIVMENHNYNEVIGNTAQAPYENSLLSQYGLATNYSAVSHPSLPNYLALVGGSTFGISTDCTDSFVASPSIVNQIEASGRTWKSYQESMPAPCFVGDSYPYMHKHNPFLYFNDIRTNPVECQKDVPFTQLAPDLTSVSTTPNYAFITPNMCNDTHDCPIQSGDQWLAQTIPMILRSPAFTQQNSVLFLTYDEDDNGANQVPTMVIANTTNNVPAGFRSVVAYTHYSLLKTIEASWLL